MTTKTVPGIIRTERIQFSSDIANTIGTSLMDFKHVQGLFADTPLRRSGQVRLDDSEVNDDLHAANDALAESSSLLPYADVRRELGLGD